MGVADHLLLGLAAGAGFQLTEEVIRRVVAASHPDPGIFGRLIQELVGPVGETDYGPFALFPGGAELGGAAFAGHGVLTALVAGGIGLAVRLRPRYGARIVLIPAALWLLAVIDHALFNFAAVTPIGNEPTVTVPGRLLDLHGAWGGGKEAVPLLLALIAAALVVDYRAVGSARPSLPPLPVPPERGRAREVLEETATLIGAAARGPHVWRAAIPWLRARRELAYGIDHGEPRRRAPDADALATAGLALRAALAAAVTALALTVGVAGLAAAGAEPAFLAGLLDDLGSWWDGLSFLEQTAAVLGLAALLALAGMGFLPALGLVTSASTIAEHGQGLSDLIRDPRKAVRDFVKDMTPGQALAYALGLVLERVLRGLGKRFADRFGPRRATGDVAGEAEEAVPPPRVHGTIRQDAKAFRDAAQPGSRTTVLARNMREPYRDPVTGKLPPRPAGQAAHHIVPRGLYVTRSEAARSFLERAQARLHRLGIGADDAVNGVFLDLGPHARIHTDYYFERLALALERAQDKRQAEAMLARISKEIVNGTFP